MSCKMMYYLMNHNNQLNGWSQVVPQCMPWAAPPAPAIDPQLMPSAQVINGGGQQIMQFTAPTNTPINWPHVADTLPLGSTSIPPILPPSMSPSIPPSITSSMFDQALKNQVLNPDPCTSQTATRWELLNNLSTGRQSAHQHLKRRNDSSDEDPDDDLRTTPVKQHISEDKVSAIFNRLQITNNHTYDNNIESEELDENTCDDDESRGQNSIVFADELQTAIKSKTLTERVVQNELDKHSKALVLWQPPNPILSVGLNHNSEQNDDQNKSNSDRNETNNTYVDCDLDIDYMIEEVLDCDNDMEL